MEGVQSAREGGMKRWKGGGRQEGGREGGSEGNKENKAP